MLRVPRLAFEYKDPFPNFDRRKVKGLICNLFTLRDESMALPLEIVAGGRVSFEVLCFKTEMMHCSLTCLEMVIFSYLMSSSIMKKLLNLS